MDALEETMVAEAASPSLAISLMAGGLAGTSVDVVLFPLDTLKTRLQSAQGFAKAGGFRGVYSGLSSVVVGSAPGAALFYGTYEMSKHYLDSISSPQYSSVVHMVAASLGEVAGCLVRVPTEQVKQRMQAHPGSSAMQTVRGIVADYGVLGMWRGYSSLIMREIPFAIIQFPLYEKLKVLKKQYDGKIDPWEAAICGSISGGTAGAITTPLDVVKTRIMLAKDIHGREYGGIFDTFSRILKEEGWRRLYSGIVPRTMWISVGGCVFFGVIESAKKALMGQ
eukprot:comp16715_c0_seq1/m.14990 comp16715_c0_seq1/g.14990  ORF comp16715_c0_seq1/g.14990 comp16715_c0_seq1/m.14990 type:complete len:280 (-) comp16715_c0_seq1:41-880(-)